MIDFRVLYENNNGPLQKVKKLIPNCLYITEDGTRIRYLGEDKDSLAFEINKTSPLVEGVLVSELPIDRKGGLPLFWKLLNKDDEDTSKD